MVRKKQVYREGRHIVAMFQQKIKLTLSKKQFGLFLGLSILQDVKTNRNGKIVSQSVQM